MGKDSSESPDNHTGMRSGEVKCFHSFSHGSIGPKLGSRKNPEDQEKLSILAQFIKDSKLIAQYTTKKQLSYFRS